MTYPYWTRCYSLCRMNDTNPKCLSAHLSLFKWNSFLRTLLFSMLKFCITIMWTQPDTFKGREELVTNFLSPLNIILKSHTKVMCIQMCVHCPIIINRFILQTRMDSQVVVQLSPANTFWMRMNFIGKIKIWKKYFALHAARKDSFSF